MRVCWWYSNVSLISGFILYPSASPRGDSFEPGIRNAFGLGLLFSEPPQPVQEIRQFLIDAYEAKISRSGSQAKSLGRISQTSRDSRRKRREIVFSLRFWEIFHWALIWADRFDRLFTVKDLKLPTWLRVIHITPGVSKCTVYWSLWPSSISARVYKSLI